MSRIGKKIIDIPAGVTVEQKGFVLKAKGSNGELQIDCNPVVKVVVDGSTISVLNETPEDKFANKMHGTVRALIANVITGVSKGFTKKMEIFGTGYNLKEQGGKLVFQIGFCHPIEMVVPKGIKVTVEVPATRGNEVPAKFTLFGINKEVLGQFAADIRKIRPPEPYKGKGIRYADEHVRRKVGKAFASGGA